MCENAKDPVDGPVGREALLDNLPDPWEDAHDIEYWVWDGSRLVPASADEVQRIREQERVRNALWRFEQWEAGQRRVSRRLGIRGALRGLAQVLPRHALPLPRRSIQVTSQGSSSATGAQSKSHAEA